MNKYFKSSNAYIVSPTEYIWFLYAKNGFVNKSYSFDSEVILKNSRKILKKSTEIVVRNVNMS
jgi:hypothetical protein